MDSFSSRSFAGVEAVVFIALNTRTDPVRSKEICEYQQVAQRHLEPLLQRLVRAGILRGVRGPKGGYFLARERRKVSLKDILDAMPPPLQGQHSPEKISPLRTEITGPLWHAAKRDIMERFATITLADLCEQAMQKNIQPLSPKRGDFTI